MSTTYKLPYLHEVEYVRFSGNNWFDTGYVSGRSNQNLRIEVTCRTCPDLETRVRQRSAGTVVYTVAFGTQTARVPRGYGLGIRRDATSTNYLVCNGSLHTSISHNYAIPYINEMHKLHLYSNYTFGVDGVDKRAVSSSSHTPLESFFIGSERQRSNLSHTSYEYSFIGDIGEASVSSYIDGEVTPLRTWYPVIDKMGRIAYYEKYTKTFIYPATSAPISVGPIVHTHDSDFEVESVHSRLGNIPGDTIVLTGDDVAYAYKVVDELPSPATSESKVVILSTAQAGYAEGQVLLATKTSAGWGWKPVTSPMYGVGVPTDIKSHKIGNKVVIRWKDPDDVYDETGVSVLRRWKKTRLVRKLGSYPTGPYDGAIRCESTTKNYYETRTFVDILPKNINTGSPWFYKLFAYSEDGVISTSVKCQFSPLEFSWEQMSTYIQANRATSIFGIGDVIELPYGTGIDVDPIYRNMRLQVAGFDIATPTSPRYKHSVTLIGYNVLTNVKFDEPWGMYRRVKDEIASSDTSYYEKVGSSYQYAIPQPSPGTRITEVSGYYKRVFDSRSTTGSNQWSESRLREWLNAVKMNLYILTSDTTPVSGKTYYTADTDGSYIAVTDTAGKNPHDQGWYEVKEALTYLTTLMPPLIAFKKLDADPDIKGFYKCIIAANVKSALNGKIRTASTLAESVSDRVYIPSVTEITGNDNYDTSEGKQFPLFATKENRIRWRAGYTSTTPVAWWTRSPYITDPRYGADMVKLNYVTNAGELSTINSPSSTSYGVLFVLTIG